MKRVQAKIKPHILSEATPNVKYQWGSIHDNALVNRHRFNH